MFMSIIYIRTSDCAICDLARVWRRLEHPQTCVKFTREIDVHRLFEFKSYSKDRIYYHCLRKKSHYEFNRRRDPFVISYGKKLYSVFPRKFYPNLGRNTGNWRLYLRWTLYFEQSNDDNNYNCTPLSTHRMYRSFRDYIIYILNWPPVVVSGDSPHRIIIIVMIKVCDRTQARHT